MKKRLIAMLVIVFFLTPNFNFMKARAYTKAEYFSDVRIGITNRKAGDRIGIKLEGNYIVDNQLIPSGSSFVITKNGTSVTFNGKDYSELTFIPENKDNKLYISNSESSGIFSNYFDFVSKVSFQVIDNYIVPINIINIEEYLKGVVGHEMYPSFNIEALKAQSVAARTYTLANISRHGGSGYSLCDTTHCQVFYGYDAGSSYDNVRKAVDETAGEVLTYNGSLAPTYYSSSNGGYVEDPSNVWGGTVAYLKAHKDDYDGANQTKYPTSWSMRFSTQLIDQILKAKGTIQSTDTFLSIDDLDANNDYYPSGRVRSISIRWKDASGNLLSKTFTKEGARTFLSANVNGSSYALKSSLYSLSYDGTTGEYVFNGRGNGHGIGMSQIGAQNRALAGQDYRQILNFYHQNDQGQSLVVVDTLIPKIVSFSGDKNRIFIDEQINFSAKGQNGSGKGLLYKYIVQKNGQSVYTRDFSSDGNLVYKPYEQGDYTVTVYLKDALSSNQYDDSKSMTFTATRMVRIAGTDRYETSVKISQDAWPNGSSTVVIASGEDYADALCAGPLAKKYNAPILLTRASGLSDSVKDEIARLGAKSAMIVGGEGVVSKLIVSQLSVIGITSIQRIGGVDRFDTSAKIASYLGNPVEAAVVNGFSFPDSISIASIASSKGMPILLTRSDKPSTYITNYMSGAGKTISKTYIIGGTYVVNDYVKNKFINPERIAGADRFETNYLILERFKSQQNYKTAYIASGMLFPDALAGSSAASMDSSPVVLVNKTLYIKTQELINNNIDSISRIKVLGGEYSVSSSTLSGIK